jgi:hypothetical protein
MSDEEMKPRNPEVENKYDAIIKELRGRVPAKYKPDFIVTSEKICAAVANVVSTIEEATMEDAIGCAEVFFDVLMGVIREVNKFNPVPMRIYRQTIAVMRNDADFLGRITGQENTSKDFLISNGGRLNTFESHELGKRS